MAPKSRRKRSNNFWYTIIVSISYVEIYLVISKRNADHRPRANLELSPNVMSDPVLSGSSVLRTT